MIARRAEEVGCELLTVGDRLLTPESLVTRTAAAGLSFQRHRGRFFEIPPSRVDLRPAQAGGPPVLLGGFTPAARWGWVVRPPWRRTATPRSCVARRG